MRVWDLHPGYLSRQSLLGQHAEIHAVFAVIVDQKKGYSEHPETRRWSGNLQLLKRAHDFTVLEMKLRSFNHQSPLAGNCISGNGIGGLKSPGREEGLAYIDRPAGQILLLQDKYRHRKQQGRIPLPKNIFDLWAHHKYSVMARGYNYYKEVQGLLNDLDQYSISETAEVHEKILALMREQVTIPALSNTADHLWGYLKRVADESEKEDYLQRKEEGLVAELIPYFYTLATKYNCIYLQHSTIFADFTGVTKQGTGG
ncbi:MAG: DUF1722 domain-containing protein [Bacillota bacterium]